MIFKAGECLRQQRGPEDTVILAAIATLHGRLRVDRSTLDDGALIARPRRDC
jgi:hypothetical protein